MKRKRSQNKALLKAMRRLERADRLADLREGRKLNQARTFKSGKEYDRRDRNAAIEEQR